MQAHDGLPADDIRDVVDDNPVFIRIAVQFVVRSDVQMDEVLVFQLFEAASVGPFRLGGGCITEQQHGGGPATVLHFGQRLQRVRIQGVDTGAGGFQTETAQLQRDGIRTGDAGQFVGEGEPGPGLVFRGWD